MSGLRRRIDVLPAWPRIALVLCALASSGAPVATARAVPPPVTLGLSYAAYVHGFRALLLTVGITITGDRYAVDLEDHTVGLVGALINNNVRSEAHGTLQDGRAVPVAYVSRGHSRGADRATAIDYAGDAPFVRTLTPVEPDRDRVAPTMTVGAIDPLSLVASLFGQVAAGGTCASAVHVFDGARLSAVQSWVVGRTTIPDTTRSPYAGTVTECDFRDQELAGFLHDADYARAHRPGGGVVYLAPVHAGGTPVPIRARFTTVDHGEINLYLIGVTLGAAG